MLEKMNGGITIGLAALDAKRVQNHNFSQFLGEFDGEVSRIADPDYEQFLADVWVGIVLTLMVLSCVCCMCSCLLYHKFQQWKRSVLQARRNAANLESGQTGDSESLPSYTIVSGLPSYEEALEQLRKAQNQSKTQATSNSKAPDTPSTETITNPQPIQLSRLSVTELFQFYKTNAVTPMIPVKT